MTIIIISLFSLLRVVGRGPIRRKKEKAKPRVREGAAFSQELRVQLRRGLGLSPWPS